MIVKRFKVANIRVNRTRQLNTAPLLAMYGVQLSTGTSSDGKAQMLMSITCSRTLSAGLPYKGKDHLVKKNLAASVAQNALFLVNNFNPT